MGVRGLIKTTTPSAWGQEDLECPPIYFLSV